jgi:hypothetical protein
VKSAAARHAAPCPSLVETGPGLVTARARGLQQIEHATCVRGDDARKLTSLLVVETVRVGQSSQAAPAYFGIAASPKRCEPLS